MKKSGKADFLFWLTGFDFTGEASLDEATPNGP